MRTIKRKLKAIWNVIKGKPKDYITLGVAVKECRKCDRVEQKEGYWKKSDIENEDYVCSNCGGAAWYYDVTKTVQKSHYCPNCGAYMRKGE